MFRRQNENEPNPSDSSTQGSLLGESNKSETVSLLSPQQAASYQAQQAAPAPAPAPAQPIATGFAPAARPNTISAPSSFRPASLTEPKRAEAPKPAPAAAAASYMPSNFPSASKETKRVLTVGPDIFMKGEINSCDRLVIEGKVDATVSDVHIMELAEGGSFKGTASVEYAEISGLFEGDLTVKSRLIIYASGKVCGKITYGEIEIERGGELTGEVKTIHSAGQQTSPSRNRVKEAA